MEITQTQQLVLAQIRENGHVSRADITLQIPRSATTVKRTVEELIESGVVRELQSDEPRNRPGRRTARLSIEGDYAWALGFAVSPECLDLVAVDLSGKVRSQKRVCEFPMSPAKVVEHIVEEARDWEANAGTAPAHGLLGIGVGVAGVVDAEQGVVRVCPNLTGWEDVALRSLLAQRAGGEVVIDDEVRCMALCEARVGRSKGEAASLFVYVGRGVGAGIIIDGRLYRGRNGVAGEFGHITVRPEGRLCNCGNRGCLEAVASLDGIIASANELIAAEVQTSLRSAGRRVSLEDISHALNENDKIAAMLVEEASGHIGTGVADLVNIFDPGLVLLGGEVIEAFGDRLVEGIRRTVALRGIPAITGKTRIEVAATDGGAARGAAMLVIERFFGGRILNLD